MAEPKKDEPADRSGITEAVNVNYARYRRLMAASRLMVTPQQRMAFEAGFGLGANWHRDNLQEQIMEEAKKLYTELGIPLSTLPQRQKIDDMLDLIMKEASQQVEQAEASGKVLLPGPGPDPHRSVPQRLGQMDHDCICQACEGALEMGAEVVQTLSQGVCMSFCDVDCLHDYLDSTNGTVDDDEEEDEEEEDAY